MALQIVECCQCGCNVSITKKEFKASVQDFGPDLDWHCADCSVGVEDSIPEWAEEFAELVGLERRQCGMYRSSPYYIVSGEYVPKYNVDCLVQEATLSMDARWALVDGRKLVDRFVTHENPEDGNIVVDYFDSLGEAIVEVAVLLGLAEYEDEDEEEMTA